MPTVVSDAFIVVSSDDVKLTVNGVEGAGAAVAGTAEVTWDLKVKSETLPPELRRRTLLLWRVEVRRKTGASATNYTPQVYNASGAATTDWTTKYLGAATAPGTRFDVTAIDAPMRTDTSGKVYFKVNGDAADTFDFAIWFKVVE